MIFAERSDKNKIFMLEYKDNDQFLCTDVKIFITYQFFRSSLTWESIL